MGQRAAGVKLAVFGRVGHGGHIVGNVRSGDRAAAVILLGALRVPALIAAVAVYTWFIFDGYELRKVALRR
ncbi:hypothetical protein D3C84_1230490 [compost metagenome]